MADLLQQVTRGAYQPLEPDQFDDPDAKTLIETLNRVDAERKKLEFDYNENLDRSEARLRSIIETTPVGICITNQDGIYEYVNPTYCKLYGYRNEELIGKRFTMVVPPEDRDELVRLHDAFMGRRYELRGEWSVVKSDGSPMSILADAAYIIDIDNNPKKVTFVLDISERKRAEEMLKRTVEQLNEEIETREQLEQIKARVERMIRHDLRNPLNGILAATEIMMTDELPDDQRNLCMLIRASGRKLDSMLSSGADLIKMEEGTYTLRPQRINLRSILTEAISELASIARESGVRTTIDYAGANGNAELMMDGESLYLSELFANLLRNAIEASTSGDEVRVDVRFAGAEYEVSIHNPAAIPEDIRQVFFHPYTTSGKDYGTGLGTYVAALITRVHNGTIDFTSSEEDGTTVTVTLPIRQKKTGRTR